jgi:hypothetical protein
MLIILFIKKRFDLVKEISFEIDELSSNLIIFQQNHGLLRATLAK